MSMLPIISASTRHCLIGFWFHFIALKKKSPRELNAGFAILKRLESEL